MAQAKGVLPRGDDREVLYRSPRACGYFVGVRLDPAADEPTVRQWLAAVQELVDDLVRREPDSGGQRGARVAAVATGFSRSFFLRPDQSPRFPGIVEVPACFAPGSPLPTDATALPAPADGLDALFYVMSVYEARVNAFVTQLSGLHPPVAGMALERGYQRTDETEPFGYRDGVRNVRSADRSRVAFVHTDDQEPDEPAWADGGTYMAFMRIRQSPDVFLAAGDDAARDAVIGRRKDGTRLDLPQGTHPHAEPTDPPAGLPSTSHVRKAAPRGPHDDVQIFRRGLPFMEISPEGELRVGLQFCSFQSSLDHFDTVFNDWMANRSFPPQPGGGDPGTDALLDPARQFTSIEKAGFYFVPPYEAAGLDSVLFPTRQARPPRDGRLVVRKRVHDPNDPTRRFERRGFKFDVLDPQGHVVPGSEFVTDSAGRGLCPAPLTIGTTYTLRELETPVPNLTLGTSSVTMQKRNQQVSVVNQVTQPNSPYGG